MILGNNSLVEVEKELTEFKEHHRRDGFRQGKSSAMEAVKIELNKMHEMPMSESDHDYQTGVRAGVKYALEVMDRVNYSPQL